MTLEGHFGGSLWRVTLEGHFGEFQSDFGGSLWRVTLKLSKVTLELSKGTVEGHFGGLLWMNIYLGGGIYNTNFQNINE